ncbi:uncharacterized protein LOC115450261 [Manduca sexta]|uniref:uncharacterized protein LOC115450261 n=1 Tax=Manduca sexta TaxID=7130 RepID=UPI001182C8B3|nr:uncharacterized protein LOC115450261 [Manduca sexta]
MMDELYLQQPPKKQLFYKVLSFTLSIAGLYWYELWDYKFPKLVKFFLCIVHYTVIIFTPICVTLQMLYIYTRWNNIAFSTHGTIFTIVPITFLILTKVLSAQKESYRRLMKTFLQEIHLCNFGSNSYMKQRAVEVEKYSRYLATFFFVFLVVDWALWTIVPIVFNLKNSKAIENKEIPLKTCFYMWLPFDYEHEYKYWVITHIANSTLIALGCIVVTSYDTINYSIVFHLIGHIKSLKHLIKTNISQNLSDDETKRGLVEVIRYHCFVLKIFGEIERAFGINVTGNYLYNLIADSLLLYHLMLGDKENKLMYGVMLLVFMGGLIVMTLILEEVRRQTFDIPQTVYDMPWEKMSVSNQKIVVIMLARTQPTLEYKSAGGLKAGVNPTIQIIKSTFSYYVMLKSSL